MLTHFLPYRRSRIGYTLYGRGRRLVIGCHGYAESAESFAFLESALGAECTLLVIDLPFHGRTEWKEGLFLDPADFLAWIEEIVGGLSWVDGGWWLLGYSMGGRIALQLWEMAPEMVERVVLIAPDGLKMNPWYWLTTQTRAGNRLFRWTMRRPGWFFGLLRLGNWLGLVNPGIYKYAVHYIDNDRVRRELYQRWTLLRGFRPDIPHIQALIAERRIPIGLLYGRYDRIIRWETGEAFCRALPAGYCSLVVLDSGHQLLRPGNEGEILSLLSLPK